VFAKPKSLSLSTKPRVEFLRAVSDAFRFLSTNTHIGLFVRQTMHLDCAGGSIGRSAAEAAAALVRCDEKLAVRDLAARRTAWRTRTLPQISSLMPQPLLMLWRHKADGRRLLLL
jgi:hypothetical protein